MKIELTTYKVNNRDPFDRKLLWSVDEPSVEMGSEKHGDVSIVFQKDGTIQVLYWSPRIPDEAVGVRPASFTLHP